LLVAQKKFETIISTFSKTTLSLQQTKQRHEKAFYLAFCLTQLAKEASEK
jgi:hypothetical protein